MTDFDKRFNDWFGFSGPTANARQEKVPERPIVDTLEIEMPEPRKTTVDNPYADIDPFPEEWTIDYCQRNNVSQDECGKSILMYKYSGTLLWEDSEAAKDKRRTYESKIVDLFGAERGKANIARAREWAATALVHLNAARAKGKVDEMLREKIHLTGGPLEYQVDQAIERAARVEEKKHREFVYKKCKMSDSSSPRKTFVPLPSTSKTPFVLPDERALPVGFQAHANEISRLQFSTKWSLYVDESGTEFETGGKGIIAGVLCDDEKEDGHLPEKKPMHATDETADEIEAGNQLIRDLVETPNTGVLALPVSAMHAASEWSADLAAFITIVLRMLPLGEGNQKTHVTINIENRAPYEKQEDFFLLRDTCRAMLLQASPERAKLISIDVCVQTKEGPYDAYPDYVAYICYSSRNRRAEASRDRLEWTGWEGSCYLNYPACMIGDLLQCFISYRSLRMEEWEGLLSGAVKPDAVTSLVAALLDSYGQEARRDKRLWQTYLDHALRHLSSKAINMRLLCRQFDWLSRYQPESATIPPRLKLLWLTGKLATENHRGAVSMEFEEEFKRLCDNLFEEDAPLVCRATLHLAVARTNAFRFAEAKEIVDGYLDRMKGGAEHLPGAMFAIPGLKYAGQLVSSYGQHLAFLGNLKDAKDCFRKAIEIFGRLSDEDEAGKEISQTLAYLLTVQMDDPETPDEVIAETVARYFGSDSSEFVRRLARTTAASAKYAAHLLVRYIASGRAPESFKDAYVQYQINWGHEFGHPWELVDFYRAYLFDQKYDRVRYLKRALKCADVGDVTIQVIACVIRAALMAEGACEVSDYLAKCENVITALPDLGEDRIVALRAQPTEPMPIMDFAKKILPFNFR